MNEYTIDTMYEGLTESFTVNITQEMLDSFRTITGDTNPMHTDDEFAKQNGFPQKIAYGMLTASFISTLAGVYLPGRHCLIHSVETNFVKPVFVGDTLTVQGICKTVDKRFGQAVIQISIKNQNGQKVVRAILKAGVLNEQR